MKSLFSLRGLALLGTLGLTTFSGVAAAQNGRDDGLVPHASPLDVWPADALVLIAKDSGGGLVPPAAPGSNCAYGAMKFTFNVNTGHLQYELCKFVDWDVPLTTVSGETTLTRSQVAAVHEAMQQVTYSASEFCGADKPFRTLTVTSLSGGARLFQDSFYACMGKGPYVDNIDLPFGVLANIVDELR